MSVPPCIPTTAPDMIHSGSSGGLPIFSVNCLMSSIGEFPCNSLPWIEFPCICKFQVIEKGGKCCLMLYGLQLAACWPKCKIWGYCTESLIRYLYSDSIFSCQIKYGIVVSFKVKGPHSRCHVEGRRCVSCAPIAPSSSIVEKGFPVNFNVPP